MIDSATVSRRFRGPSPDARSIRNADLSESEIPASGNRAGAARVVALVEGPRLRAAGLAALLGSMAPEVIVHAVLRDVAECERAIDRYRPDIVILDVRTVRPALAELLRSRQVRGDRMRSLAILGSLDRPGIRGLLAVGLGGALSADIESDDLLNAIRVLRAGRLVLDPAALTDLLDEPGPPAPALSPSELEILRLAADGLSNEEIARTVAISPSTLKRNLRLVIGKLAARDRTSAVAAAVRAGLI